jgi:predicted TIM-barrel fold metal-dependent hydrolase
MQQHSVSTLAADLIVDGQTYVASDEFLPPSFIDSIADSLALWMGAQGIPVKRERVLAMCGAFFNDPQCDELVRQMDLAGISQSVLMLPDFSYRFRGAKAIDLLVGKVRAIAARHPNRLHVWLGVDPRWGKDGLDLFERETRDGLIKGMKLYPPCGYSPSDDALYPFYELCRERGLPVSVHSGGTASVFQLDLGYPRLLDKAARDFPDVDFVLSHASTCYTDEALMLCSARPNVYLEVSGYASQPIEKVGSLFQHGVGHKVIFGTDWPSFRAQGTQHQLLERLRRADGPAGGMRPFEVERFLGKTVVSLMPQAASHLKFSNCESE